jgi:hypothetical protein
MNPTLSGRTRSRAVLLLILAASALLSSACGGINPTAPESSPRFGVPCYLYGNGVAIPAVCYPNAGR